MNGLPLAKNMLEAAYRTAMLITQTAGRDRYFSAFKQRPTPSRQRVAGNPFVVPESGMRGWLIKRRVTGFVG